MAEWLRRQIRNLVGSARVGSNPIAVELYKYHVTCVYTRDVTQIYKYAWLAEWSKAVDLSSIIFGCVGSNPTSGITKYFFILSRINTSTIVPM